MRVACIVSPGRGHLDFGGSGFIKLAEQLCSRGHEIKWITTQKQADRLGDGPWQLDILPTQSLDLQPFNLPARIQQYPSRYQCHLQAMQNLDTLLRSFRPHLVLIDRILALAAGVVQRLEIPWVSLGKPSGWWVSTANGVLPSSTPIASYQTVCEQIKHDLAWSGVSVDSLWANSPHLNISFLGRNFYAGTNTSGFPSAYVNHFEVANTAEPRSHFGLSCGNTGDPAPFVQAIRYLAELTAKDFQLDFFIGDRLEIEQQTRKFTNNPFIHVHRWVDFNLFFPLLKFLIFPGGNGTLWQCVNHFVPMLVVPSNVGDQYYNACVVNRLNLGHCNNPQTLARHNIQAIVDQLCRDSTYKDNITNFRGQQNYTHTMESITPDLEDIASR